jgi:hypothetical protein
MEKEPAKSIQINIERHENGYTVETREDGYRHIKKTIHSSLSDALGVVTFTIEGAPKAFNPLQISATELIEE